MRKKPRIDTNLHECFRSPRARFGAPGTPELRQGGRRSASGPHTGRIRPQAKRIRRGERDAAFSTANATADRNHKNDRDILYRARVKSTPSGGLYEEN